MPMVNVKIAKDGATSEQKTQVIAEMTDVLVLVLGKNPATTIVILEEVDMDSWGIGGETVAERRAQGK